jgi:hypothetical protein
VPSPELERLLVAAITGMLAGPGDPSCVERKTTRGSGRQTASRRTVASRG